jgi:hypothetical protein
MLVRYIPSTECPPSWLARRSYLLYLRIEVEGIGWVEE